MSSYIQPFVLANYRRLQMMYCDTSFSNNKAIVTHPPFPLQCVLTGNVLAIPTGLFYVNFAESPECGDPEKPIYGIVEVRGDHQVAHYSCIPGYIRRGNASRTCTWAGWRPVAVPECIGT